MSGIGPDDIGHNSVFYVEKYVAERQNVDGGNFKNLCSVAHSLDLFWLLHFLL